LNPKKDKEFSASREYVVLYAGIELDKEDYKISGNKIEFTLPPEESGCLISIRYLGDL
jgi:hypothetical protein